MHRAPEREPQPARARRRRPGEAAEAGGRLARGVERQVEHGRRVAQPRRQEGRGEGVRVRRCRRRRRRRQRGAGEVPAAVPDVARSQGFGRCPIRRSDDSCQVLILFGLGG